MSGVTSPALHTALIITLQEVAARSLVPTLTGYAVRSTVVLLVAWLIIASLLRRSAASTRHAVWIAALTVAGVMPGLVRVMPDVGIHVSFPRAVAGATSVAPVAPVIPGAHATRAGGAVSGPSTPMETHEGAAPPAPRGTAFGFRWASVIGWIPLLWIVGVAGLVTRFTIGSIIVWKCAFNATPVVDPQWPTLVAQIARELRIRRPVTVLAGRTNTVPATWGIIYPVVLLPRDTSEWPLGRRRAVLLHELAHVARLDAITQVIAHLALAANWFNPLAWVAVARMRDERERACDDVVLNAGTLASSYAAELLALVRTLQPADAAGVSAFAMAHHGEMEGRLLAILDPTRKRAASSRRMRFVSVTAAVPCIGLLAAVHPSPSASRSRPVPVASPSELLAAAPPTSMRRAPVGSAIAPPAFAPEARIPGGGAPSAPMPVSQPRPPAPPRDTTYCPVRTEFARGGVSADSGELAAFEAEHDDRRILVIAADGHCPSARIDGEVGLRDDASDVTTLGPASHVIVTDAASRSGRVAEGRSGASGYQRVRRADVSMADAVNVLYVIDGVIVNSDTLTHRYFVDGQERPWEEGQAWYAATLAELVRETAFDVRDRVTHLRQVDGVNAVLAEIRQLRNEHARRDYFDALLDSGPLPPDVMRQAAVLAAATLSASADRDRIIARLRTPTP